MLSIHLHLLFHIFFAAVGLHHSNAPFSQYKAQSHDRSKAGSKSLHENKLEEVKEGKEGIRHRSKGKKPKKMLSQFDEVVSEVCIQKTIICHMMNWDKFMLNTLFKTLCMLLLMEVSPT